MPSDERKTVALHSTLLVLLGEKSGRWSSSPRHCAFSNRSCAHRFAPKWSALTAPRPDSVVRTRLPELHVHGLARSATIRSLKVEWTSHAHYAHAMKHGRGRSRKRARTQWARLPLILNMLKRNLKLLGGFIGNGEPPLCTRLQETNRRHPTPFPNTNEVEFMPATSLHDLLDSMHDTLSQLQIAAGRACDVIYSLIRVSSPWPILLAMLHSALYFHTSSVLYQVVLTDRFWSWQRYAFFRSAC